MRHALTSLRGTRLPLLLLLLAAAVVSPRFAAASRICINRIIPAGATNSNPAAGPPRPGTPPATPTPGESPPSPLGGTVLSAWHSFVKHNTQCQDLAAGSRTNYGCTAQVGSEYYQNWGAIGFNCEQPSGCVPNTYPYGDSRGKGGPGTMQNDNSTVDDIVCTEWYQWSDTSDKCGRNAVNTLANAGWSDDGSVYYWLVTAAYSAWTPVSWSGFKPDYCPPATAPPPSDDDVTDDAVPGIMVPLPASCGPVSHANKRWYQGNICWTYTCQWYKCAWGRTAECTSASLVSAKAARPPPEWTCAPRHFFSGDGCHCQCGVWDPDCDDQAAPMAGGCVGTDTMCTYPGRTCVRRTTLVADRKLLARDRGQTPHAADFVPRFAPYASGAGSGGNSSAHAVRAVPAAWRCPWQYYNSSDGCDCNCGVADPDCAAHDVPVLNCGTQAHDADLRAAGVDPAYAWGCSSAGRCVWGG